MQAFKDYQKRKSDIYQALAIQHELHPLYSSELHGFIEFLKLKPELLHGYLDFFSPYLSKVNSQFSEDPLKISLKGKSIKPVVSYRHVDKR